MKKHTISLCLFIVAFFAQAKTENPAPQIDKSNLYYETVMNSTAPENDTAFTAEVIDELRNHTFIEFFKTKELNDTSGPYIKSIVEAGTYCATGEEKPQNVLYGCYKAFLDFNKTMKDFVPSPYKDLYLDFGTHPHTPSDEEIEAAHELYRQHLWHPVEASEHQKSMFYVYNSIIGRILNESHNSSPQKSKGGVEIYIYYLAEGIKVRNSQ